MKLDWIFVKPPYLTAKERMSSIKNYADNSWAPTYPKTLYPLSIAGELSDHGAVITDLLYPASKDNYCPCK